MYSLSFCSTFSVHKDSELLAGPSVKAASRPLFTPALSTDQQTTLDVLTYIQGEASISVFRGRKELCK